MTTYQIAQILDEMPSGRVRKPKTDKYQELKGLLDQVPEGKVAQVPITQSDYRAFSAGVRAAGVQTGKKVTAKFKNNAAFVSWEPLTEANKPKRRGGRRKAAA